MTFAAVKASNTRRISAFRATVRSSLCIFYFSVDDVFEKPTYVFQIGRETCMLINDMYEKKLQSSINTCVVTPALLISIVLNAC